MNPFEMMIQSFLKSAGIEPGIAKKRFDDATQFIAGIDARLSRIERLLMDIKNPPLTITNGVEHDAGNDAESRSVKN